jgi:hypothetical protein
MLDWSRSWGKKTVPVLFAGRNPQDIPGYAGGAAGFLKGGAMSAGGAASARMPTGGLQRHPAPMASLDSRVRGSQKCKEARGAQDDLSDNWTTTRTLTGTKTTTRTTRQAMPSLLPLPQRNGLDDDAMYNDMSQAALQLDRHRHS